MKDYYAILQINKAASGEVIKAAYKALVKKYHPDNCNEQEMANTEKVAELNEAYETLSDEKKRKDYDAQYQSTDTQKSMQYQTPSQTGTRSEKQNSSPKKESFFTSFFKAVGEEMMNTLAENQNTFNEAYLKGCEMNDLFLIRRYKSSSGIRRNGYAKVLEERGILQRDCDGRLIPAYSYRSYFLK